MGCNTIQKTAVSDAAGAEFNHDSYRTAGIQLRQSYAQRGYVIVRRFFEREQMVALIDDIKAARTRNGVSGLNRGHLTFYSNVFFNSQALQSFVAQPKVVELLKELIGPDFWVRWDQAVAKGPGAGDFGWHQDNGYSGLRDAHCQLWIALTDMTPHNGGLWLQPGSHTRLLPHKTVDNHRVYDGEPQSPVFIEAKPGDIVVFSSFMLHTTTPNKTEQTRWAYVVEYMSLDHFDPSIEPPYFIVARNGKPKPEFVRYYRGRLNPLNQIRYLGFRRRAGWNSLKRRALRWAKDSRRGGT